MRKLPLFEATATLVGTIIGAGVLGIPYVVAKAGFPTGVILIVLIGLNLIKKSEMIMTLAIFLVILIITFLFWSEINLENLSHFNLDKIFFFLWSNSFCFPGSNCCARDAPGT